VKRMIMNASTITTKPSSQFESFLDRHVGSDSNQVESMLNALEFSSLDALIDSIVPAEIRLRKELDLPKPLTEAQTLTELKKIFGKNNVFKSYIGLGFQDSILPGVIQRNILENPGWYTAYTPYQAEIAQGRLEALLNFQTMIMDLTSMDIANASLLDEATASAEAMTMFYHLNESSSNTVFVSNKIHPQNLDVLLTRANPLGIKLEVGDLESFQPSSDYFAVIIQYPDTDGNIFELESLVNSCKKENVKTIFIADLLSLVLIQPPGEFGADAVVGSSQRFGLPLGYGGPHAGFFATKDEYKRNMPGRLVGVSKDKYGKSALRLSLQTREQHIRRDKATSNICTAQVLLAVLSSMFAVYHGPSGLKRIASRVHALTNYLREGLQKIGHDVLTKYFFDTLRVKPTKLGAEEIKSRAEALEINFRYFSDGTVGITLDEVSTESDIIKILNIFNPANGSGKWDDFEYSSSSIPEKLQRHTEFLTHPIFNTYHTETEMLRYIHKLETKDLALNTSMIPLGSCTMKLNATTEMIPVTWAEVGGIHPFAPRAQVSGYLQIFQELESWLSEITGFSAVSLQPNAGSQGEYAGLLCIRDYHKSRGETNRNICLIPISAHGTNPASAVMAGFKVVVVNCDSSGNIDVADLKKKAETHSKDLGALMITYPSTHGVFEEGIKEICEIVHQFGGQVYMDGANMNAQVGLCRPGDIGADVCHLNLHKTFCIPHGGGGPGVGPIGVKEHLAPFLPGHPIYENGTGNSHGSTTSAPFGSASILVISYAYIRMLGASGLTHATKMAILNANYIAKKLEKAFPVLYKGKGGLVAHECILDFRKFKSTIGIEVEDIAKRLIDYGFHAPTMSWPVAGTLMVEPTESESIFELDKFCSAMLSIFKEIQDIESGILDKNQNPLKNAPHTAQVLLSENWNMPYSRERAAYPLDYLREFKYWSPVSRVDNVYGDRNLVCSCLPLEDYQA
jgi:glycine dehydrogenase